MIQTETCEVCGGGIYREFTATWDSDKWRHMDPEFIQYPHKAIVKKKTGSTYDDEQSTDGTSRR